MLKAILFVIALFGALLFICLIGTLVTGCIKEIMYKKKIKKEQYNTITFKTYTTMKAVAPEKWSVKPDNWYYNEDDALSYRIYYETPRVNGFTRRYSFLFASIKDFKKWQRWDKNQKHIKLECKKSTQMQNVLTEWRKDIDTYTLKATAEIQEAERKNEEIITRILKEK